MKKIIVKSCGECPLVFDSHIGCFCYETSQKIPDQGVRENCPLKKEPVQIEIGE